MPHTTNLMPKTTKEETVFPRMQQHKQADQSTFFHIKQWVRILIGSAIMVLTCGIFFGYPALKPILINEGVYANLCSSPKNDTSDIIEKNNILYWTDSLEWMGENNDNRDHDWILLSDNIHKNSSAVPLCEKQNLKLNSISTAAIAGLNAFALPVGIVVDLANPRLLVMSSSLVWCMGFVAFGQSNSSTLDLYIPSVIVLAITGGVLFMSLIRLKQYFKSTVEQSLVIGILNAMWDLSSVTPWIFNLVYFRTNITLKSLFSWYSVLAIPAFIYGLIYVPFQFEMKRTDERAEEYSSLIESDSESVQKRTFMSAQCSKISIYFKDYWTSVRNGLDINLIFLYSAMAAGTLSMSLFMATVTDQIRYIEKSEKKIGYMIDTLSLMLPILGTVSSIVAGQTIGLIKKLTKYPYIIIFSALLALNTGWTILSLIPVSEVQYATFVVFVVWRISFFVVFSEYFLSRYGILSFYALGLTIAGCFSFSTPGWNKLAQGTFKGNFFVVNVIIGGMNVLCGLLLLVVIVFRRGRSNEPSKEAD